MHFDLVDRVLEQSPTRIVTLKLVTGAEEYLQDHFATFPVLPGVLMLEALVQAARRLAESAHAPAGGAPPLVLGRVRALKYGSFVKPGMGLRTDVTLTSAAADGSAFEFKAEASVIDPAAGPDAGPPPTAVSGKLTLRPLRVAPLARPGDSAALTG